MLDDVRNGVGVRRSNDCSFKVFKAENTENNPSFAT